MIVDPSVKLLAHTTIDADAISELMEIQPASTDAETLVTFAGRSCYESWHRPSEATHDDADYINRTIFEQTHGSILEHATATLYFTGVSRAFLTELTRHRHLSFSVRSQRFVDEGQANIVIPPAMKDLRHTKNTLLEKFEDQLHTYRWLVQQNLDNGYTRKQAREAARAILPSMTETKMTVTGNFRAWLQVIERRTAPDADAELQKVMGMAREVLKPLAPSIFKDNK